MNTKWECPIPISIADLFFVLCHNTNLIKTEGLTSLKEKRILLTQCLYDNKGALQKLSALSKDYLDTWFVFVSILEHDRKSFGTGVPFFSEWLIPSNTRKYITSNVWRFETIMTGLLHATIKFNIGMEERKAGHNHEYIIKSIREAYSTLKNVCLVNIIKWELRREISLPFECTISGCKSLMGICLIEIQQEYIRLENTSLSSKEKFGQLLWISKMTEKVQSELKKRVSDRTIINHPWILILEEYKLEALVGMYIHYVHSCNMDQTGMDITPDTTKQIHFICACVLEIIKNNKKTPRRTIQMTLTRTTAPKSECMMRINELQQETERIYKECTAILNAQFAKVYSLQNNSVLNLDPRNFIPNNWKRPFFYMGDLEMSLQIYNSYYGLSQEHKRIIINSLFYKI